MSQESTCKTENAVVDLIRSRGVVGREKYQNSMDRRDLSPAQWMQHHQEELCDALQYAERNKNVGILLEQAHRIIASFMPHSPQAVEWIAEYGQQFTPPKYQPSDANDATPSTKSEGFAMKKTEKDYLRGWVSALAAAVGQRSMQAHLARPILLAVGTEDEIRHNADSGDVETLDICEVFSA